MPGSITYDCTQSSDKSFATVHFKCEAKSCNWKQDKSVTKSIKDMKDNRSIVDKVGKKWAVDNGQWCFEEMNRVINF
jgi:hypothetical protein